MLKSWDGHFEFWVSGAPVGDGAQLSGSACGVIDVCMTIRAALIVPKYQMRGFDMFNVTFCTTAQH